MPKPFSRLGGLGRVVQRSLFGPAGTNTTAAVPIASAPRTPAIRKPAPQRAIAGKGKDTHEDAPPSAPLPGVALSLKGGLPGPEVPLWVADLEGLWCCAGTMHCGPQDALLVRPFGSRAWGAHGDGQTTGTVVPLRWVALERVRVVARESVQEVAK